MSVRTWILAQTKIKNKNVQNCCKVTCHPFICCLLVPSDLSADRLAKAKELGADFVLPVKREDVPKDMAKRVDGMLGGMPHITIECTGVESSIQTAIYVSIIHQNNHTMLHCYNIIIIIIIIMLYNVILII